MKNLVKRQWLFLFALVVTFGLLSCSDDDGPKEQFSIDGSSFSLKRGYRVSGETDDGQFVHLIALAGGDLEISDGPEIEGRGDVLQVVILSESSELEEGEYDINDTYSPGDVEEAGHVMVWTDYRLTNDGASVSFDDQYLATDGKIKVKRSGSTYTITIEATETLNDSEEEIDENLKAYYKGSLQEIEVDETSRAPETRNNPFFKFR